MTRVIIAGSRQFTDWPRLVVECDRWLRPPVEIVSGGARGADQLGEAYAKLRGYPLQRFEADWASWGRRAGPIRNRHMAWYADRAIVFWDGRSRGTLNLIEACGQLGKPVKVILF